MSDYNGMVIADIHLGVMDYSQTYKELDNLKNKLDELTEKNKLDFIIIDGDLFDKKLYSNDSFIKLAQNFIVMLTNYSNKIRMVNGTRSHDNDQYGIFTILINDFKSLISKDIDIKIINTVSDEELLPDMNILYVPEEYIINKGEYYKEYLSVKDKYDYIFGHGVIDEAMGYVKKIQSVSSSNRKKAPVFTSAELSYACKGKVYFGHYHENTNIKDKVFYVGSFSRFRFGENKDKGFYLIHKKGNKFSEEFIINDSALKYETINYGYNNKIFNDEKTMIDEFDNVLKKKDTLGIDYLRLIINIPEDYEKSEFLINYLNEKFKFNDDIKIEVVNGYIRTKKKVNKEKIKEIFDKFDIIFDKNQSDENKISFFIKEKNNKDISPEKVAKYLKLKITDILSE